MKQSLIRALATAAGLTLAASTWAQSATTTTTAPATQTQPAQNAPKGANQGSGKHAQQGHHGQHQGGEFGLGQLPQRVIDQLALSPAQKSQLESAQKARKEMRAARQSTMATQKKVMSEQLAKDQLDPRAMMAQSNQAHAALSTQREAVQQKWLAFWDGLSVEQRKTIMTHMKSRMASHPSKYMQHGQQNG